MASLLEPSGTLSEWLALGQKRVPSKEQGPKLVLVLEAHHLGLSEEDGFRISTCHFVPLPSTYPIRSDQIRSDWLWPGGFPLSWGRPQDREESEDEHEMQEVEQGRQPQDKAHARGTRRGLHEDPLVGSHHPGHLLKGLYIPVR